MNNKFENFKDFLYESIDYFMIIGIIFLVIGIIGWRLDLLFTESNTSLLTEATVEDNTEKNNTKEDASKYSYNKNEDIKEKSNYDEKDDSENTIVDNSIKITVPPGSNSTSIAEILKDKGLIESSSDFVLKTEEMNLSTKLKSGEFDLDIDDDLEDIIHILTR